MKLIRKAWESFRGRLPTEYLNGLPDIRVIGMHDVYVEAHRGLLAYSEEEILVKAADRTISVSGSGLTLRDVTMQEVHISGSIHGVGTAD